jgi:hypothetical protein
MRKSLPTAAAATMLMLTLAGCAGAADPEPTGTSGATSPPATDAPSPSASPTGDGSTGDGSAGQDGTGYGEPRCLAGDLAGSTEPDEGGGAAGAYGLRLVLVNDGAETCALQGWPGVSFVGGGDGSQLGVPATQNRGDQYSSAGVVLEPGGSAYAPLMITQALNYANADCQPRDADGFRVYPPGNEESLFIEAEDLVACTTEIELLDVGPMQQG